MSAALQSYYRSMSRLCDELCDAAVEKRPLRPLAEVMAEDETPECAAGCGATCPHPEEVEINGSWTCQGCEEEQAREQIADARSGR